VTERGRARTGTPAVFEPTLTSIPMARRYVLERIGGCRVDQEIALLLTSELVTNAIRHARTRFAVEVNHSDGVELRVAVSDDSPAQPRVVVAPPEAQSGRGLFFVDQYASAWGVDATPDGGKRVWFALPCEPPTPED
jgi:anti-sigma regulatory factor (Ser/Thr protein kinase)